MRLFHLLRHKDISGLSGTGKVAQGIEFDNGRCAMTWLTDITTVVMYDKVEDVEYLHGHQGATELVFEDPWKELEDLKFRLDGLDH